METLKDKVAIIGMGCTKTGNLWDKDGYDLLYEACFEAFEDAGIGPDDVQAAWVGVHQAPSGNIGGQPLARAVKLGNIPITRVENRCATGGDAFRNGCIAVASGLYDIVLVAGVEKAKDRPGPRRGGRLEYGAGATATGQSSDGTAAAGFAPHATRYAYHYGYKMDDLRRALNRIEVKNQRNGALNPKAWLRKEITLEEALKTPMIAWPLNLADCAEIVDGGAACILTRPELARQFRNDYVLVKAARTVVGNDFGHTTQDYNYVTFVEAAEAARQAYQEAGVRDPMKELGHVEVHDAFSIVELIALEDIGVAPRGKGPEHVMAGFYDLEGEIPVNTDGGLKCTGHPLGATGIKMIYEAYRQLQGKAGPRQLKNPKLCLTHTQGGGAGAFTAYVGIYGPRD